MLLGGDGVVTSLETRAYFIFAAGKIDLIYYVSSDVVLRRLSILHRLLGSIFANPCSNRCRSAIFRRGSV